MQFRRLLLRRVTRFAGVVGVIVAILSTFSGCMSYALWREDVRSRSALKNYRERVGKHAEKETLSGTWKWERSIPKTTKHGFTLSLFSDGTFALLHRYQSGLLSPGTLTTYSGTWAVEGAGQILLSFSQKTPPARGVPTGLLLDNATNDFVEIDKELREGRQSN